MVYCHKCGFKNQEGAKFCSKCGSELIKGKNEDKLVDEPVDVYFLTGKPIEKDLFKRRKNLIRGIASGSGSAGIILFLIGSKIVGGLLILSTVLVFASNSLKAVYVYGILLLLMGLYYIIYFNVFGGIPGIILSFAFFIAGGWFIYKTRKLEEELQNKGVS